MILTSGLLPDRALVEPASIVACLVTSRSKNSCREDHVCGMALWAFSILPIAFGPALLIRGTFRTVNPTQDANPRRTFWSNNGISKDFLVQKSLLNLSPRNLYRSTYSTISGPVFCVSGQTGP